MNEEQARYQRAKKRVEDLKGIYLHLGAYVLINIGLFLLNIVLSPHSLWFYWVLLFWGIFGIVPHGLYVLGLGRLGADWEEKKIAEIMERETSK